MDIDLYIAFRDGFMQQRYYNNRIIIHKIMFWHINCNKTAMNILSALAIVNGVLAIMVC